MPARPCRIYCKTILVTVLSLLCLIQLQAQDFTIEHSNCLVRVFENSDFNYLNKIIKEELTKKNFKVKSPIEGKRILGGELYANYTVTMGTEKLYKKCSIEVKVLQSKNNRPAQNDSVIFKKTNSRTVPRITFSGSERCTKAMQETFIHMPKCVAIGFAGEKK